MSSINHFSDAIVDYSGIGKTVNDLRSRFQLLEFLDLCSFMEGVVLHDRVIIVGIEKSPEKWKPALQPLLDAGVLIPEPSLSTPVSINQRLVSGKEGSGYLRQRLDDAYFETSRLISAEKIYHCSAIALLRQKPVYERAAYTSEDHSVCNLVAKYQKLSEALAKLREKETVE